MELLFDEEKMPDADVIAKMYDAALRCMEYAKVGDDQVEISLSLVSPEEIRQLNKDYRGVDAVTDVLSFPQFTDFDDLPEGEPVELGDVIICEERAHEQAKEFGHSYDRELLYLFTHSVFHLLGYDHMQDDEKAKMREAEETVLTAMGLARP